MGSQAQTRADYLDNCRAKRNVSDYDRAGEISDSELRELMAEGQAFRRDLLAWLRANHAALVPKGIK
jgi:hypothetical protein